MLARVAETLYWMARYVERAENTARMVQVNSHLVMDAPRGIAPGWEPLIAISGMAAEFDECCREPSERNVVKFLIGEARNPSSILNSLRGARENCRTVREILPQSAWERINELYIYAKENVQRGLTKRGRDEYLDDIIAGSQQINGLLGSVMYRDVAWQFIRIGRNLERADMTTRIIDVRSTDLFPDDLIESRSLDSLQWISVLRSLSGYQTYRRQVQIRVSRPAVLGFLFQDPFFPRAYRHCVEVVKDSVDCLPNNEDSLKRLRDVVRKVSTVDVQALTQNALHEFVDDLQLELIEVHDVIAATYFPPALELAASG